MMRSAGKSGKILRVIGGATDLDFYGLIGDWYDKYEQLQKDLEVVKYIIVPAGSDKFTQVFKQVPGNVSRFIKQGLSSPTYTRMTPEMVSIEIYGSKEPIIIQMRNRAIAADYIEKFNLLWEKSDEDESLKK